MGIPAIIKGVLMYRFTTVLLCTFILLSSCSTPTGLDGTTKWEVCYSLPLTNVTVSVNDVFNQLILDSSISVNDDNDSTLGDTMTFSFASRDSEEYRFKLLDQNLLEKEIRCDNITISEAPEIVTDLVLREFIDEINTTITAIQTIPSTFFELIKFDSLSEAAEITIYNNSQATIFQNVELSLLNEDSTLILTNSQTPLTPGKSITIQLPVALQNLKDSLTFKFNSTVEGITPDESDILSINLDLNGTSIEEAVINSSYIDYDFSFNTSIPIPNDSFLVHYADIKKLSIPIELFNPFPFSLDVTAELPNVVDREYAQIKQWETLNDVTFPIPASVQKGTQEMSIHQGENQFTIAGDNVRILPAITSDGLSSIPIKISGTVKATGSNIHISKWKEIRCKTVDCSAQFSEIKGHYREESHFPGSTKSFNIPLSGINTVTSQLRDKVRLINSVLEMTLDFKFKDYSSIEKMKYWCILEMYCHDEIRTDTFSWVMEEIVTDEKVSVMFDCNTLTNSFPDSITYRVAYSFPEKSTLHFADSLFSVHNDVISLVVPVEYDLNLTSDFIWEISDSILLDLGTSHFPLSFPETWKKPLEDKTLEFSCNLLNNSNFSGTILSLAVPNKKKELLDSLSKEELFSYFEQNSFPEDFIPILGDDGITVPHRGQCHNSTVHITDHSIHEILTSDTLYLRQVLLIPPTKADALLDSDFLSLDASFALKGIQSSDMFNME